MLERIQKSRSFEQQQRQQPRETQRSASLADLTQQEVSQDFQLHYDSGFYIGDDSYGEDDFHHDQMQDGEHLFEEEEEIFELDL